MPQASSTMNQIGQIIPANLDHQALLRTIAAGHFLFTSLVLLGSWIPPAYQFYNGFLLAGLLWSINSPPAESDLPLLFCLCVDIFSFLMDIMCMANGWADAKARGWESLALAMAIFHLVLRIPSVLVLLRVRNERSRLRYDNWEAEGQDSEVSSVVGGSYNQGGRGAMPPGHHYDTPDLGSLEGADTKPIAP